MVKFTASIHLPGINPCIDIPEDAVKTLLREAKKEKRNIPVEGKVNDTEIKTTVVKYKGSWRLYLNTETRLKAGVGVGDTVGIVVEFDSKPREVAVPPMFAEVLSQNEAAKDAFEKLPPTRQKEILSYLNWLKTDDALERNIKKVIRTILGKI